MNTKQSRPIKSDTHLFSFGFTYYFLYNRNIKDLPIVPDI